MNEWRRSLLVCLGAALVSTAAFGLPWDIDMADSQAVKAFEREMKGLPEGVVSQANVLTPTPWTPVTGTDMAFRVTPEAQALSPFTMWENKPHALDLSDERVLRGGEKMYGIYCTPCHGDGQTLGAVAAPGLFPNVAALSGAAGRLQDRTDAEVYLTILNGWGLMPNYDWALSSDEAWSVVAYVRTMNNGAYRAPEPPPSEPDGGAQ